MFYEIGNHLWQSTLFAALIAALCHLLRRDGAHARYWLWWIASLKFLVPFSLVSAIGSWLGLRTVVHGGWTNTVTVVSRPFATAAGPWTPGTIVLALWLTGSLILMLTWLARAGRLRRILRRAERDPAPLIDGRRSVSVYRADAGIEPGVVGVLRTALLLPRGLEQRLSAPQLEAVIAHELCHIRRRDNLTAAVHMLVEAVFWFHPMIWWIGAKLVDERERACDESVVALGHDREIYATSILDVCEHFAVSPLRCAAGISGSDLKLRITQIMSYEGMCRLRLVKKLLLGTGAVATLAIPLFAGIAIQETAVAQESGSSPSARGTAGSQNSADSEYLPIYKVQPTYPPQALARGLEGYVIVGYTVATDGTTKDVKVIESSASLFEEAAIESAKKFRYKPRIVNGRATAVPGVMTKIIFYLESKHPESVLSEPPED